MIWSCPTCGDVRETDRVRLKLCCRCAVWMTSRPESRRLNLGERKGGVPSHRAQPVLPGGRPPSRSTPATGDEPILVEDLSATGRTRLVTADEEETN